MSDIALKLRYTDEEAKALCLLLKPLDWDFICAQSSDQDERKAMRYAIAKLRLALSDEGYPDNR